jgi:hypothetical protein
MLKQPHLSESMKPTVGKGQLTRPDFLVPNPDGRTSTAVSNKSRATFIGATAKSTEVRVVADLLESVQKYSGPRQVRRTGTTANVTRVWLLYDAPQVPERLRPVITKVVRDFQITHQASGLTFEVGIL